MMLPQILSYELILVNKLAKVLDFSEEINLGSSPLNFGHVLHRRPESRGASPKVFSHSSSSSAESLQTVISKSSTPLETSMTESDLELTNQLSEDMTPSPKQQCQLSAEQQCSTPLLAERDGAQLLDGQQSTQLLAEQLSRKLKIAECCDQTPDNSTRPFFYIGDSVEDGGAAATEDVISVKQDIDMQTSTSLNVIQQNNCHIEDNVMAKIADVNVTSVNGDRNVASLDQPELLANGQYKFRNRMVEKLDLTKGDSRPTDSVGSGKGFRTCRKSMPLLQTLMKDRVENQETVQATKAVPIPTEIDKAKFHRNYTASASMLFNCNTGLPLQSSPAPIKKNQTHTFGFDCALTNPRSIKNAISCSTLEKGCDKENRENEEPVNNKLSRSAPASTNSLLGNFEESLLNGRIEPVGIVDGFTSEIGASGSFCPKHIQLPVTAYFFKLSDDNAPSPYLGHINLESRGKRGYHVPTKGTVQVTLFNPNKTVVKMFVVMYDLSDMPANSQTFLRQRTLYMPVADSRNSLDTDELPAYLRYLIHLRFKSSKTGRVYLHTDIRVIFARDKFEFDPRVATYELRSFTEGPSNPKFSPIR